MEHILFHVAGMRSVLRLWYSLVYHSFEKKNYWYVRVE